MLEMEDRDIEDGDEWENRIRGCGKPHENGVDSFYSCNGCAREHEPEECKAMREEEGLEKVTVILSNSVSWEKGHQ